MSITAPTLAPGTTGQLARRRRMEQLLVDAAKSRVYDSRIEIWSARCGLNPATAREWLAGGYPVEFTNTRTGERVHLIRPGELV